MLAALGLGDGMPREYHGLLARGPLQKATRRVSRSSPAARGAGPGCVETLW